MKIAIGRLPEEIEENECRELMCEVIDALGMTNRCADYTRALEKDPSALVEVLDKHQAKLRAEAGRVL